MLSPTLSITTPKIKIVAITSVQYRLEYLHGEKEHWILQVVESKAVVKHFCKEDLLGFPCSQSYIEQSYAYLCLIEAIHTTAACNH